MAHALFSPSAAHRWLNCPGSLVLTKDIPQTSSEHADWGTAAHEVAAEALVGGRQPAEIAGRVVRVNDRDIVVDEEMVACVQTYIDAVREYAAGGGHLMVEQRVEFGRWVEQPGQFGTSDAIVIQDGGDELQIHDLKGGRGVKVDAERNEQLMLYALGALDLVEPLGWDSPERVRLVIHQPRLGHLSEWDCGVTELLDFANRAKNAAEHAVACLRLGVDEEEDLKPGGKQCRWCPAKATCGALANFVQDQVGADFDAIADTEFKAVLAEPIDIASAMSAVDLIEGWCKAVRAETERRLLAGMPVAGWKLVEGRRGARRWVDQTEAEQLLKTMRLKHDQIYEYSLISPTTAEKLAKAGDVGPRQWPKLQSLITQTEGRPSVAPESDKRPALVVTPTADEFDAAPTHQAEMADLV